MNEKNLSSHFDPQFLTTLSRRELFQRSVLGLGAAALSSLTSDAYANSNDISKSTRKPHFAPKAKRVIFLHMTGGPSHVDLFDPKPQLTKYDGKEVPDEFVKGIEFGFIRDKPALMRSPYKFTKHGECGMDISDRLPLLAKQADKMTLIRSMVSDEFNHANAELLMSTGFRRVGRPGLGAWTTYGLGTENENLPGFVVLVKGKTQGDTALWSSGFLPTSHQGVQFRTKGDPVLNLSNPRGFTSEQRKASIDSINRLNRKHLADVGDPEIATRISQYELAFRMQTSVPELMELSGETQETLDLYGAVPGRESFANNCLLARRLVERGTRFVQIFNGSWDQHEGIYQSMPRICKEVDRPCAALLEDLDRRKMLDDTLVIWTGEFGRTPVVQEYSPDGTKGAPGRDHHKDGFSAWLAGGGIKRGHIHGATDEFGIRAVEDIVHVHDLQATMLHLLGLDHKRLTFPHQGRDFRLTDVAGKVVKGILA